MAHLVHIAFGSNLGDSPALIVEALRLIDALPSTRVMATSSIYSSKAWGYSSDNEFYNGVCVVHTSLSAFGVLGALQRIETHLGRIEKTTTAYADRAMDLDIITYGRLVFNSEVLTLPHGLAHVRNFVLEPLSEISPEWVHPLYLETAEALLNRLNTEEPLTRLDAL